MLGAACLLAGYAAGNPVDTPADRERWINRSKPRALLRGRPRKYRIAAWLFIAATLLAVAGAVLDVFLVSSSWFFWLGTIVPVCSLVALDMLQHREVEPVA